MHCQQCHKNFASVRYAEVVDGEVVDQHLCRECMDRKQNDMESGFEFSKPSPFVRKDRDSLSKSTALFPLPSCKSCGTDLNTIKNSGMAGCPDCYRTFEEELTPTLSKTHLGMTHQGKVPTLDDTRARVRADLQTKRALLKSSLGAERYEEAAVLRDEIKALESGLSTSERGVE